MYSNSCSNLHFFMNFKLALCNGHFEINLYKYELFVFYFSKIPNLSVASKTLFSTTKNVKLCITPFQFFKILHFLQKLDFDITITFFFFVEHFLWDEIREPR